MMHMEMDPVFSKAIRERVRGRLAFDEPMAAHTWLRVGGPADIYVQPEDEAELVSLVKWLVARDAAYIIVGGGSNLLVTDRGIRGVVVDTTACIKGITRVAETRGESGETVEVRAMAGEPLNRLCRYAIEEGLAGLIFAVGIPGTVGGAICMNAGAAGRSIADILKAVRLLLPDGRMQTLDRAELSYVYRGLVLPETGDPALHPPVVLEGRFALSAGSRQVLEQEAEVRLRQRREGQPKGGSTAGCFFKNPSPDMPAGRLIDQAGMKGRAVGDAIVSEKHANFIVNQGNASAADILQLMATVQDAVYQKFHITLAPEVRIVGE